MACRVDPRDLGPKRGLTGFGDRGGHVRLGEAELAILEVDLDGVFVSEFAFQQHDGEWVLGKQVDCPLQRPRAVDRVPAVSLQAIPGARETPSN